jgi:hypothetical protein
MPPCRGDDTSSPGGQSDPASQLAKRGLAAERGLSSYQDCTPQRAYFAEDGGPDFVTAIAHRQAYALGSSHNARFGDGADPFSTDFSA